MNCLLSAWKCSVFSPSTQLRIAMRVGILASVLATASTSILAQPTTRGAETRLSLVAPELKGRTVEEVRVVGNNTVSTNIIRNLIRTRPSDAFDPATVEEDYQRVYGLNRFANVQAKVEPTATGVIVIFEVQEQRQIRDIRFKGNAHVTTETLLNLIAMKPGEAIDPFRIATARQAIARLYLQRNYPYAHADVPFQELSRGGVLEFDIVEGPHVRIRKIQFLGNRSFTDEKLKDQIKSGAWFLFFSPGRFDPEQVEDDVGALRQFYLQHGFFDVRVGRKLIVSPDQTEMMISFPIEEGVRYKIGRITFKGATKVSERALREGLKLTEGRPYDVEALRRDVRSMVRVYSRAGGFIYQPQSNDPSYLNIDTKQIFNKEAGTVDLIHDIHEGRQFRVGRFLVRGNSKIQDKVILREMRVSPGQPYNSFELQEAIDRLRATNLIAGAQITPIGDAPDVRDVLVEVKEAQTRFLTIGAGFTSNAGVLGNIGIEERNFDIANWPRSLREAISPRAFSGAGQYFKIQLEPGTIQSRASVQFQEPNLLDTPYSLSTYFYYSTRVREFYDEVRTGANIGLGRRWGAEREWSARLNLRGEDVDITHIDDKPLRAPEILSGAGHHTVTSAGFDIRRDDSGNILLPWRGTSIGFGYERVGALGGPYDFDKFSADATAYFTLGEDLLDRKTILTTRARVGYINGESPFFEKFYGGGSGSIRGFRYRGVSPRSGPDDDPVGGVFSLTGGAELGFPLAGETLRGVVFADVGTVEREVRIGTIRSSVGIGVRLTLPIFGQIPLALDVGFPITKSRQDDTQIISFSLGFGQ